MAPEVPPSDGDGGDAADQPTSVLATGPRGRTVEEYQKIQLEDIIHKDLIHSALILEAQELRKKSYVRTREETDDYRKVRGEYRNFFPPSRLYGYGYSGYGNGNTDTGPTRIIYTANKQRAGNRKAPKLRIKRKDMNVQADWVEDLVPIRVEVDWEKIKLRDTFTWNFHDRITSTSLFAQQLVEDYGLPLPFGNPVLEQVQQQIDEQIADFYPPAPSSEEEALDPELPYSAYKNDEMRISISLNITIGTATLEDKFEWDINNPMNSPEEFAQIMCTDLSLSGEWITAIAHCIREQSQLFVKSLYIVGHPFDGRPVEDQDLVAGLLPSPLVSTFRPQQAAREYGPIIYEMNEGELERSEKMYSREQRRQKRSVNRRGGPTLPDLKDRQRTVRTRIVSSVLPNAAEHTEPNPIYKRIGGTKKRTGLRDDLSDSSEEEESGPEDSPVIPSITQGTARTRNMRGAATQAQQRMANLGRSETPEAIAHHHETRTSARRYGGPTREESVENPTFIIKLRVGRAKLRKWDQDMKAGIRPPNLQKTPSHTRPQSTTIGTPTAGSMGPPSTPGTQSQPLPAATTPASTVQIGRIDAPPPPAPGQPAHPVVSNLFFVAIR
jgi:SWI/SNF-related matrix-associated actin-dependent regulator of chromatin subfamily B protein 1